MPNIRYTRSEIDKLSLPEFEELYEDLRQLREANARELEKLNKRR